MDFHSGLFLIDGGEHYVKSVPCWSYFIPYFKQMDKDYKTTIGKEVVFCLIDGITYMSDSYLTKEKETKVVFANSALKRISQAEIFCKALFDLKAISQKQIISLSYNFGQIKMQLYRWLEKLKADGIKV